MGEELVSDPSPINGDTAENGSVPFSYTKVFYDHLPFYLAIGMTWDEYWKDDPSKAKYYRQAYQMKRKMENTNLWLQGRYIYEAIYNLSPVLNAFMKDHKPRPYIDCPFPLTEEEIRERELEKAKAEQEKIRKRLMQFM